MLTKARATMFAMFLGVLLLAQSAVAQVTEPTLTVDWTAFAGESPITDYAGLVAIIGALTIIVVAVMLAIAGKDAAKTFVRHLRKGAR